MIYVIFAVLIALELIGLALGYNKLQTRARIIDEAWSDVTVALERRHQLVPNLVSIVKATSNYEADLQLSITRMRAGDVRGTTNAEAGIQKSISFLKESNPQITAQESYMAIMKQLIDTEDNIQGERLLFNRAVADFNKTRKTFPSLLSANAFGFQPGP